MLVLFLGLERDLGMCESVAEGAIAVAGGPV